MREAPSLLDVSFDAFQVEGDNGTKVSGWLHVVLDAGGEVADIEYELDWDTPWPELAKALSAKGIEVREHEGGGFAAHESLGERFGLVSVAGAEQFHVDLMTSVEAGAISLMRRWYPTAPHGGINISERAATNTDSEATGRMLLDVAGMDSQFTQESVANFVAALQQPDNPWKAGVTFAGSTVTVAATSQRRKDLIAASDRLAAIFAATFVQD